MKRLYSAIIDRLVANPITTIIGVMIIGVGIAVYLTKSHEAGVLMIGAGTPFLLALDK